MGFKDMTTMGNQRKMKKGQMSFDLAFALLFVLMLLTMLSNFSANEISSVEGGRALAGLSMVGDSVAGKLTSFYNSLILLEEEGDFVLELPVDFVYADENTTYALDYNVTFTGASNSITIADRNNSQLEIVRSVPFDIECTNHGGPPPDAYHRGDVIMFTNCTEGTDEITCDSC
jgi:DNA polymerase elongation subunit (family B)